MTPILPRILLWTDKEKLSDFFYLDEVNEDFYDVLCEFKRTPQLECIDEVKLFNEIYYQATRIVYESRTRQNLVIYAADIKSNLGWNFGAELVMTMVYYLLSLTEKNNIPSINLFLQCIKQRLFGSVYLESFKSCFEKLSAEGKHLKYSFKPCPYPVNVIRYQYLLSWDIITNDFDLDYIVQVLNLWDDINDKYIAADMIKNRLSIKYSGQRNGLKRANAVKFIEKYLNECKYRKKQEDEEIDIQEELRRKNDEIEDLRNQLSILEMSNKSLKLSIDSMVSDDGVIKSFTLQEIVAYCKNKPYMRQLLLHLNREKEADEVESLIKRLIRKNIYIGGNYIEKQINNYGKGM